MAGIADELARLAELRDKGVLTEAEFEAEKARVLGQPAPVGAPPSKGKSKLGIGCLVLVAIVILLIVIGSLSSHEPGRRETAGNDQSTGASATPPLEVTAAELFNAYQANEAAAQKQYGDRPLMVSGTVDGVDLDIMDKPTVNLRTPNEFMSAHASLTEASQAKADQLAKGQRVRLLCGGVSEVIGTPMLKDCELQ